MRTVPPETPDSFIHLRTAVSDKCGFHKHATFVVPYVQVLGLVGTNGIGKSTALKILAGKLKPNLGRFESPPDWQEILQHFRGSELQNYFTRILEDNLKAIIKPQYVDHIPKAVKGKVGEIFTSKNQLGTMDAVLQEVSRHSFIVYLKYIYFFVMCGHIFPSPLLLLFLLCCLLR